MFFASGPLGIAPFSVELPPWRKVVEATGKFKQEGNVKGVGGAMAQGIGRLSLDGKLKAKPIAVGTSVASVSAVARVEGPGVVIIESTAAFKQSTKLTLPTVVIAEVQAKFKQTAVARALAVALGTATVKIKPTGKVNAVPIAIGTSSPSFIGDATWHVSTAASEAPRTATPETPELQPLMASHEADQLESELKALFADLFKANVRPDERYVNVLGMPQHGVRTLIEQSLAADGLSIYRGADNAAGAGAYLLRAWRARNPKRGLHLLKTYLQLLWPNVWTADQMWQGKSEPYPTALVPEDGGDHYLTSRVHVTLPAKVTTGGDVNAISSGLRASLPARMVMNFAIVSSEEFEVGVANLFYAGTVAQSYEGTFK